MYDYASIDLLIKARYPSLLQSSDVDGGSSVAVLTYCWRLLEALHHPDIVDLFLNYLLAIQKPADGKNSTSSPPNAYQDVVLPASSLKSPEQLDPSFFSLVDLLISSVKSSNSETVTAALRVVTVVLNQHHPYAISNLLQVTPSSSRKGKRTLGALSAELELLLSLAADIGGESGMDDSYANSLKDALATIESHGCSQEVLWTKKSGRDLASSTKETAPDKQAHGMQSHTILLSDPLLISLISALENFFTNDIEVNLGLTGVFAHLASCPHVRLDGWLVVDPSHYIRIGKRKKRVQGEQTTSPGLSLLEELDLMERVRIDAFNAARVVPSWLAQSEPLLLKALRHLKKELETVKSERPELNALIASRKRAFEGAAEVEEELAEATHRQSLMGSEPFRTLPNTPQTKLPNTSSNTPQRGRPATAMAGQYKTPTSSPKPSEAYPRSWLTSSPLYLLSPVPPEQPERPKRTRVADRTGSPLPTRRTIQQEDQTTAESTHALSERGPDLLERKVVFGKPEDLERQTPSINTQSTENSTRSTSTTELAAQRREVSLSHVATNAVILQEFIMEMAAIVQVRSGLFDGELKVV